MDVSRIARPEQFHVPEVSGLAVPVVVVDGGKPAGRWRLFLRWADGRREVRELSSWLDLPSACRASNPASRVEFRVADQLSSNDYTGHLVSLGGVDWNVATSSVVERLQLPVLQVNDWDKEGGAYFEVTEDDGRKVAHRPRLDESGGRKILREDVALFARAVNPFNRKRFVTICNGMYGGGAATALCAP